VFEKLTVLDNLDLAESFRRSLPSMLLTRRRGTSAAAGATLERLGLTGVAMRLAGELSHGQKQWLEIGMLLVQKPRLLPPVAGMRPQERLDTGALLHELVADHTVVVSEHDMAFLRRFAHTVTVLHEGKVLSEGSVETIQADPSVREVLSGSLPRRALRRHRSARGRGSGRRSPTHRRAGPVGGIERRGGPNEGPARSERSMTVGS